MRDAPPSDKLSLHYCRKRAPHHLPAALMSLVCRISSAGDIIRSNYPVRYLWPMKADRPPLLSSPGLPATPEGRKVLSWCDPLKFPSPPPTSSAAPALWSLLCVPRVLLGVCVGSAPRGLPMGARRGLQGVPSVPPAQPWVVGAGLWWKRAEIGSSSVSLICTVYCVFVYVTGQYLINFPMESNNIHLKGVVFQLFWKKSCVASGYTELQPNTALLLGLSPLLSLLNIHCMSLSFILNILERFTSGGFSLFRTLLVSLYIFWLLCPQPGIV